MPLQCWGRFRLRIQTIGRKTPYVPVWTSRYMDYAMKASYPVAKFDTACEPTYAVNSKIADPTTWPNIHNLE